MKNKSKALGYCAHANCNAYVYQKAECLTCKRLGKSFVKLACLHHYEAALSAVRRHALVKHPVNILRATIAGLKGENLE